MFSEKAIDKINTDRSFGNPKNNDVPAFAHQSRFGQPHPAPELAGDCVAHPVDNENQRDHGPSEFCNVFIQPHTRLLRNMSMTGAVSGCWPHQR